MLDISDKRDKHEIILSPFSGEKGEAFAYGKECFLKEAETLSQFIGHRSIVRVFSYFEENNTVYFAMEYIVGASFLDVGLKKDGTVFAAGNNDDSQCDVGSRKLN